MMIDEYLYDKSNAFEMNFKAGDDFDRFLKRRLRFGAFSKMAGYVVYLGYPLGKGHVAEADEIASLYKLYGIAYQSRNGFLLGRRISVKMPYNLTLYGYKQLFNPTRQFAVTNDLQAKTIDLVDKIQKDHRTQINGVIVDDLKKIVILTSVTPSGMSPDILEKVSK